VSGEPTPRPSHNLAPRSATAFSFSSLWLGLTSHVFFSKISALKADTDPLATSLLVSLLLAALSSLVLVLLPLSIVQFRPFQASRFGFCFVFWSHSHLFCSCLSSLFHFLYAWFSFRSSFSQGAVSCTQCTALSNTSRAGSTSGEACQCQAGSWEEITGVPTLGPTCFECLNAAACLGGRQCTVNTFFFFLFF
jgi:hypothetical protein